MLWTCYLTVSGVMLNLYLSPKVQPQSGPKIGHSKIQRSIMNPDYFLKNSTYLGLQAFFDASHTNFIISYCIYPTPYLVILYTQKKYPIISIPGPRSASAFFLTEPAMDSRSCSSRRLWRSTLISLFLERKPRRIRVDPACNAGCML